MSEEVYPEALLGYRAWFLRDGLFSMGLGAEQWNSSNKKAECKRGHQHQAPANGCSCGLHAFYDFEDIRKQREGLAYDLGPSFETTDEKLVQESFRQEKEALSDIASYIIIGSVAARGKVELHWNGFRAQEMQILAFLVSPLQAKDPYLQNMSLPLFPAFQEFTDYSKKAASPCPLSLRPDPPISQEEMKSFPQKFTALENEDDYIDFARSLRVATYELSDIALSMGLPLPRW